MGESTEPRPGLVVGASYELVRRVGAGGTGEVWRARGATGMPVAVKFLRSANHPRLDRLLAREIRHTAMLSHPHVVDILDEGSTGSHRFVVLEWMAGGTLADRAPSMGLDEVFDVLRAVLAGLAHAHGRGLLHLDVKPDNILCASVPPDWRLVDFGIARHIDDGLSMRAGTPRYMAPEQQHGHGLGPAADLYAVGATAWELLTGSAPYDADSLEGLLALHREGAPRTWVPRFTVPEAIRGWVDGLLALAAADRPRSAMAALQSLERALGRPPPSPSPEPYALVRHRRPLMASRSPTVALQTLADVPVLTGRDDVCATLWDRLIRCGGCEVLWLDGPPGAGRSRLARWLAEVAAEADVATVVRAEGTLRVALGLSMAADDARSLERALFEATAERPLLWVSDGPISVRDLQVARWAGCPVLVVQSDGDAPEVAHDVVPVPPLADSAVRRLLIGLLSMESESIDALVPVVSGSPRALVRVLRHLDDQGALVQRDFRTHHVGAIRCPDAWTEAGMQHLDALRDESSTAAQGQLAVLAASPPRFRVRDLASLCALRGVAEPAALLARLVDHGVVWRHGEQVWWTDPLLCLRCQGESPPELLGMWGDVEVVRGHPLAAARRFLAARVSDSAVRLLARRLDELGIAGQVWSQHRFERGLSELADGGVRLSPDLQARCLVRRLQQRAEGGQMAWGEVQGVLAAHASLLQSVSAIDSGYARMRAHLLGYEDLAAAELVLREALLDTWHDPSAFVDHVGLLAAIVVAQGHDPTDLLLDQRDQLDPGLEGPRAWLNVRLAQAMIAKGRPADAVDLMSLYLGADGTDWAPAATNMLAEALRLSGRADDALPMYVRSARGYLDAGLFAWTASAVNLGACLGMAGRPADALHLLTALGRRGAVAGSRVLDTCRVAHVAACYAQAGAFGPAADALAAYEGLAARHPAVDPEQSVALQLVAQHAARSPEGGALAKRAAALLGAMPLAVPDTWSTQATSDPAGA